MGNITTEEHNILISRNNSLDVLYNGTSNFTSTSSPNLQQKTLFNVTLNNGSATNSSSKPSTNFHLNSSLADILTPNIVSNISNLLMNSSVNTTKTAIERQFDWVDSMLVVSFILIFIVGVTGNALVCYFFRRNPRSLHGMARLIFYLAMVDLLASIINPSLYLYWQLTFNRSWHFGRIGCKVLPVVAKCTITISFGVIWLITIERCLVICKPVKVHLKDQHLQLFILVIILYSILCETPSIVYNEVHPKYSCTVIDLRVDWFFYPTVIIYLQRDLIFVVTFGVTVTLIYGVLYHRSSMRTLKEQKLNRKNKNIMKMLIILALVFIILVFPREILHLAYMISWKVGEGIPHSQTTRNLNAFFKILHMCNSIANVFIYAGLLGRFRQQLFRFLNSLVGRHQQKLQISGKDYSMDQSSSFERHKLSSAPNSPYLRHTFNTKTE
eukprot:TCONS_00005262-protein